MHFSSIIITNTGWLLDKPRERARAKKRIRDWRDRLHLSISSRRKLSRFITFRRASHEDDVKIPIASAHTHRRASTHNTMVITNERIRTDSLSSRPTRAYNYWRYVRTFCIYIPEIVRNVLSTYRYYICVSSGMCGYIYIYIYIYIYMFTYVYV